MNTHVADKDVEMGDFVSELEDDEQDSDLDCEADDEQSCDMVSEPEDDEQDPDIASESEDEVQEPVTRAELRQRKRIVEQNLKIKWTKVQVSIEKRSLHDILFNKSEILFPFIDERFQPLLFLVDYNAIA
jgi:hypothetical protein